jgi:tight adherence protein B
MAAQLFGILAAPMVLVTVHPTLGAMQLLAVLLWPHLGLGLARRRRWRALEATQDTLIVSWADALSTHPNLQEAIASSVEFLPNPLRGEVRRLLSQMHLGLDMETALRGFSERLGQPGIEAAVCASILGRRTGGDLPHILRSIAASTREMARLEGMVRAKTSEGRYQAWVMGGIPPGLLFSIDKLNPSWTEPLWSDPMGWALLGLATVMEIAAVALIRKITAVEI